MDKGDPHVLSQGTHVYNFECKLPPELPSSFEGVYFSVNFNNT